MCFHKEGTEVCFLTSIVILPEEFLSPGNLGRVKEARDLKSQEWNWFGHMERFGNQEWVSPAFSFISIPISKNNNHTNLWMQKFELLTSTFF